MKKRALLIIPIFSLCFGVQLLASQAPIAPPAGAQKPAATDELKMLAALHSISSHTLLDYVKEMAAEKYGGRLTGTKEYRACGEWAASLLGKWGIRPAGDGGTYFQEFPDPYTLVFPGCETWLSLPQGTDVIRKSYRFDDEFIPGGTSGSGEVTAEVVYVGYGVTAPELGYDDYAGVDVKGKILLMEREAPVSPDQDAELFQKWRPYTFHQYKLENAVAHGAKGMIYNYGPIVNPNNAYNTGFIYSHVGDAVTDDMFAGTGRVHKQTVETIRKSRRPQSFATGKTLTLKNVTEHHPEGVGLNVIGVIEGSDPQLKGEAILLGAHLDGQGRCSALMPSANDNASSVAVVLGVAEALTRCEIKPRRSVAFILFGAEEQGVVGSEFYVNHPIFPLEKTDALINFESAGVGDKIDVSAGLNFPKLGAFIDGANARYIHRVVTSSRNSFPARPRQDAARFFWKGVPSVTVEASESTPSRGPSTYHNTLDNVDRITPEIMEDIAQLLFAAVLEMSRQDSLDFRK